MLEKNVDDRKKYFHEDMVKYFKRTAKELKYKPTRRFDLINKYGGYEAAIKILPTDSNTFDFSLLWEAQRLDLSVEALVTKEEYKELFPEHIVQFCKKRLEEYNYAPKKIVEVIEEIPPVYVEEEVEQPLEQETVDHSSVKNQQMLDFIDSFFEETTNQAYDSIDGAIQKEQWEELLIDSQIFTVPNKDLLQKMAQVSGAITPSKLSELEGYTATYPLYNVMNTLAKRVRRKLNIDLAGLNLSEKECWKLLFKGNFKSDYKDYTCSLRHSIKELL